MSSTDPDAHGITWRKPRHSMANGNCVEVASVPGGIGVRDSMNPAGITLRYSAAAWRAFLAAARTGKFDASLPVGLGKRWVAAGTPTSCPAAVAGSGLTLNRCGSQFAGHTFVR